MFGGGGRGGRAGAWWAGLVVGSLLLLLASRTEPAVGVQRAAARAVAPVRDAVASAGQAVRDAVATIGEIDRLRAENERLRRELSGAQQRIAELDEAATENAELRELLDIGEALEMELAAVRIISRDPSNLTWEVGIDAGSREGVRPGQPVLASARGAGALAGRVVEAGPDGARVRLIVDPRSNVVALAQASRALGRVQGQPGGGLVFIEVPVSEPLEVGEAVVTAGLALTPEARSAYPGGLLIGHVQAVEPDENGVTQTAFLDPAVDVTAVERLLVVVAFEEG